MTRKTAVIAGVAVLLAANTAVSLALTIFAYRAHDDVPMFFAALSAGLSVQALVWWVVAWIRQIRRNRRGPWR